MIPSGVTMGIRLEANNNEQRDQLELDKR
jgi:hypothetical protein